MVGCGMISKIKYSATLLIAVTTVSCTTLTQVQPNLQGSADSKWDGAIQQGDKVELTTTNGAVHKFKVSQFEQGIIKGGDQTINASDVTSVRKKLLSKGKTAAAVGGATVGGVVLFSLAAAATFAALGAGL